MNSKLRLGSHPVVLKEGTKTKMAYNDAKRVEERHRHKYELNNDYVTQLEENGCIVSAYGEDGQTIKAIEIEEHPWFVACQYHPEFKSRPTKAHPLLEGFVGAIVKEKYNG